MVRIGSRSASESLEKHTLSSLRRAAAADRVRDSSFYKRQKELEAQLGAIEQRLKESGGGEELPGILAEAARTTRTLDDLQALESAGLLRRADVVGATTTGAAKNRKLLQLLGCEVVLMEEAAQVSVTHFLPAASAAAGLHLTFKVTLTDTD